ncbi:AraC family transcriptional regulator [Thalassotalea sp. HSM 43]|uniref:helix-turn-helix domain-containing protein n=1 Tax=Thalassotalea sp. HSM 43 TaxID=2552945 RepID=UPI001080FB37|nr:helix-turn-helix domain-containing protein [Thalassotalea sp. HSM 43]QBY04121.1 AraC family transcriptional regulator [Thalassotalea sp. HSM 43]
MNVIVFNLHDISLIITIILCLSIALSLTLSASKKPLHIYLLCAFIFCHVLIAAHELSYYGQQFRYEIIELSPNLFFIGSLGYCLDAVLLYLCFKSLSNEGFKLQAKHMLHFGLFIAFMVYLFVVYYSQDYFLKHTLIRTWRLTESWHYVSFESVIKIVRLGYGIACLKLLLQQDFSTPIRFSNKWLMTLAAGFITIVAIEAVLSGFKVFDLFIRIDREVFSLIGVSSYYLTMILTIALLVMSLFDIVTRTSTIFDSKQGDNDNSAFKPDYINRIESLMRSNKPYLNSDISIESLAEQLQMSSKELSMTVNRHFQLNFYEFINMYRIEEAKNILITHPDTAITEVIYQVGFNSKSVFNTAFKKSVGMTPSRYRKSHLNNRQSNCTLEA